MKNSVNILLPLILTSLNRIDTISNAMELRGFGKNSKRTWYTQRPLCPAGLHCPGRGRGPAAHQPDRDHPLWKVL